ncbi:MAG: tRNA (adenosine(37)-N6)-threonylcarbamoyltransferase complex dimerization subunit type 1 TsaB [Gammaproteobacteria bacterium]|nr:tRNA (adenosine(37)-N6)-threonylcarbamoyltransferase complex dimerization subunit type 1 TsaB [Gammaproteobacteria bacterium]MBU1414378.1 tRNA (adenosine(37)-N6)-threonylcarbamoyltransferase complex dimerization subunit type 1 TsaB [Gammaproteobacteria bacterium]
MRLLALETATHRLSVALWDDGRLVERAAELPNGSSEWLLPNVHGLLGDAGIGLAQIDGIAFGAGPGSFTGLRLAAGCAQGLAFGRDLPVLGIVTLEALALASGETRVFACLDARMNEVYVAAYDAGVQVLPPVVCPPALAPLPSGEGWVGCGDGFASYGASLPGFARVRADLRPTASAVASLAAPRFARGEGVAPAEAVPLYVRDKVAFTTAERLARGGAK